MAEYEDGAGKRSGRPGGCSGAGGGQGRCLLVGLRAGPSQPALTSQSAAHRCAQPPELRGSRRPWLPHGEVSEGSVPACPEAERDLLGYMDAGNSITVPGRGPWLAVFERDSWTAAAATCRSN